jgi:drug/metabolite transporter (DMT)-like permease
MALYKKYYIYFLLFLAVSFWGVSYVWTKIVFEFYGPITIMFIRLVIASALMIAIVKAKGLLQPIDRSDYMAFFWLSFFTPFCYFLGENFGLLYVSPTVASVIIATIPVFAPILGFVAFGEKVTVLNFIGFFISFFGVLVMILDADFKFIASPLGVFLLLFAVLSALINVVFLKKLAIKYSSITIITVQNFLGAIMFMIVFFIFDFRVFLTIIPTWSAVGALIALAVFGSTLAFIFYTSAVRAIGIAKTSIFTNLIPVVTTITALIILKEAIEISKIIGMLIVISGLLMTQISKFKFNRAKANQ